MECVSQVVVWEQLVQVVVVVKEVELGVHRSRLKQEAQGLVPVLVGKWVVPELDEVGM